MDFAHIPGHLNRDADLLSSWYATSNATYLLYTLLNTAIVCVLTTWLNLDLTIYHSLHYMFHFSLLGSGLHFFGGSSHKPVFTSTKLVSLLSACSHKPLHGLYRASFTLAFYVFSNF
jgi:hypothetical protein